MIKSKAILIFLFIIFSLLVAIWSVLIRVGWNFPIASVAVEHGPIMINSFLASLIFIERAVAFRSKWVLLLLFVNALSIVAFVFNHPVIAQVIFIIDSTGFVAICGYFIYLNSLVVSVR